MSFAQREPIKETTAAFLTEKDLIRQIASNYTKE
jgi:hypothetical protein